MKAAVTELRDPSGMLLAVATIALARVVQPSLLIAIAAGVAVLAVKSLTASLLTNRLKGANLPVIPGLTRRELEVARYVGLGLSNKEIAARLGRRERTADAHVQHILTKLDFHSRAQVAVWAAEHGLLREPQKSAPK
jgi:DNA-binding NarL/FixJ family response regulator